MTGLNLEPFLRLLRADVGAWATLGLVAMLLVMIARTGWGSRRILRKCLVLSVLAHLGIAFYGGDELSRLMTPGGVPDGVEADEPGIREIRVTAPSDLPEGGVGGLDGGRSGPGGRGGHLAADRDLAAFALAPPDDPQLRAIRPDPAVPGAPLPPSFDPYEAPRLADAAPMPDLDLPAEVGDRPPAAALDPGPVPAVEPTAIDPSEVAAVVRDARSAAGDRDPSPLPDPDRLLARPADRPGQGPLRPSPRGDAFAMLPDRDLPSPAIGPAPAPLDDRSEPPPDAGGEPIATAPDGAEVPEARPAPRAGSGPGSPAEAVPDDAPRGRFRPRDAARPDPDAPGPRPAPGAFPEPEAVREAPGPAADPGRTGGDLAELTPEGPAPAIPSDPDAVDGPARRPAPRPIDPPPLGLPEADLRVAARPPARSSPASRPIERSSPEASPDLGRVVPGALPDLPAIRGTTGGRPLLDVPEVYRPRLDPNRSVVARRAGASSASEEAVERALDWLARHQDADGRWDAGTARYRDGSAAPGEDSFTAHCPPGDICHGECYYWEADTAVTGLALLAFLGSGYTHADGKYAQVVGRGLDFLVKAQRPDGDLRGPSRAVGMYCHAMASLALSEAYALSGDPKLRAPVERAVAFIGSAQYPGLMGWRYAPSGEIDREPTEDGRDWRYDPHPPVGDTSVLGWVVMVLKSASEVGIEVPSTAVLSARNWLKRVEDGDSGGLARYQPYRPADPVMTAEAWVCRQFLGVGGPGAASDEAAVYLLRGPPSADSFNAYYWYYATLAMYQAGGPPWERWNASIRDTLIGLQRRDGHKSGSWDPDPTRYGTHGGRIYSTALAALTLEVYYRYLRLYAPEGGATAGSPLSPSPRRPGDGAVQRAGGDAVR